MLQKLKEIQNKIGTPFYIYDEKVLLSQIKKLKHVFDAIEFFPTFAVKANANPYLLSVFNKYGIGADIVSKGESFCAIKAGIKPSETIWNGNAKTTVDMHFFYLNKVQNINIDSSAELKKWKKFLEEKSFSPKVKFFLRINPSLESSTHPHIATGGKNSKFGIPLDQLDEVISFAKINSIPITGFHCHIGSQITDIEEFHNIYTIIVQLTNKYNFSEINIGGGWGVSSTNNKELNIDRMKAICFSLFKEKRVLCEMGRFLIADCGYYVSKVLEVKKTQESTICITDGGMNHFIRPALYNAMHDVIFSETSKKTSTIKLMGKLCESGDILVPEFRSCVPSIGCLSCIKQAGAYGYSMASRYNGFPLPAEVFLKKDGSWELIRSREEEDDFLRNTTNKRYD